MFATRDRIPLVVAVGLLVNTAIASRDLGSAHMAHPVAPTWPNARSDTRSPKNRRSQVTSGELTTPDGSAIVPDEVSRDGGAAGRSPRIIHPRPNAAESSRASNQLRVMASTVARERTRMPLAA